MNLQTFKAPTMALVLQQVKSAMGPEAVILHTRTYQVKQYLGLVRREVVEVTAARGLGGRRKPPPPALPPDGPTATGGPRPSSSGGSVAGLKLYVSPTKASPAPSAAAVARSPVFSADPLENSKTLLTLPASGNALLVGLNTEMAAVKAAVKTLVDENRHKAAPNVPEALFDHYHTLIQNQVAAELAEGIVRALAGELRPDQLARPDLVRERLADHIDRLIPACDPLARKTGAGGTGTGGPHVLALVGPTGVGKTTTLAKLAANLKLKDGHRVGLITLDTYRIAAVDQLQRYADILGSPLRVVATPDELRSAVAGMAGLDFVLIDTAGRSPNDAAKLAELRDLLASIDADDVHLVLSSTTCQRTVEMAYEKFSAVRVDKIIFTKLDEASHVGVVLNVCHKVNKALSYVTMGQAVPDDIVAGHGRVLARMILDNSGATGNLPVAIK